MEAGHLENPEHMVVQAEQPHLSAEIACRPLSTQEGTQSRTRDVGQLGEIENQPAVPLGQQIAQGLVQVAGRAGVKLAFNLD